MFQFTSHSPVVLQDAALQQQLDEQGYVIIPFYSPEDIAHLSDFYHTHAPARNSGFQPTTYNQSLDYRLMASDVIKQTAAPYLERYLKDYKTYMGSFIVKHADKNSELGVHQDMTLVDESRFMGINIWSPLCDTTPENGALYLIPGSHRLIPTYRNSNIQNIYEKHYDLIKRYMKPVYMKAGEAIIFDNSILHFSPPNRSDKIRIATNVFITHQDATITICYHDKEKHKIELFEQEDDFFIKYLQFDHSRNMIRPEMGKSIGFTDYDFPTLTPEFMEARYGKLPKESWFSKLKKYVHSL